jgi:hypothetical protein
MEETNLKPAESLSIIHNMINTAKHRLADDGFLLILWGWLIFTAAISHYISLVTAIPNGHWAWNILIPLGALISLLYGLRRKKKDKVSTYTEVYLSYSWGAFLIAMMLTLVFMSVHGLRSNICLRRPASFQTPAGGEPVFLPLCHRLCFSGRPGAVSLPGSLSSVQLHYSGSFITTKIQIPE